MNALNVNLIFDGNKNYWLKMTTLDGCKDTPERHSVPG